MINGKRVIISLTTIPVGIPNAICAIQSILNGRVLPDKIVLYLTAEQFPNNELPCELHDFMDKNPILEVRLYEVNIRSYTKLIPALSDFPNDIIVTIDDDIIYHKSMLKKLLIMHKIFPKAVIGHRIRCIKIGVPYKKWKRYKYHRFFTNGFRPKYSNFQTGVGGVLYPPNCLKKEMLDSSIYMKIAPTVDDVWFWAAAVANGTKIVPVWFGCYNLVENEKPDEVCLKSVNLVRYAGVDVNRETVEKILELYPIIKERLKNEN